ncbi:hydroxyphenylacetyl-CoA thioesterase PaaI [Cognaticolwellia beringensis]|uniref:Phenylacetic acid degradation protein PaaD n=1 Tax=Cognaticolwellia beringensis TaxID=1967665 RepID=A0A222G8M1_9GAMM|nr:hydroxyphenylacetyl-CoA thioesterase PaaI [Cognaticolwellia beringensis]ASP48229.1 phenylacetic acid degradation protein PaaD [Cognaticolwellia beringensis]
MQASELANACAQHMHANDRLSQSLNMEIKQVGEGSAVVTMTVNETMVNGHQTCHGGMIFSLADSAFAFACNSQNKAAVAANCTIDFLRPAMLADVLTATATVQYQGRRTGIYQTLIVNQHDKLIAIFKGNSARLGSAVLQSSSEEII